MKENKVAKEVPQPLLQWPRCRSHDSARQLTNTLLYRSLQCPLAQSSHRKCCVAPWLLVQTAVLMHFCYLPSPFEADYTRADTVRVCVYFAAVHIKTDMRTDTELQPLAVAKLLKHVVDKVGVVVLCCFTTGPASHSVLCWLCRSLPTL